MLSVAVGAGFGLVGVMFGAWFTARRQDRMWLREQKLKAGVAFATALAQLFDHLRNARLGSDGAGVNEMADRLQEARSSLYLLCKDETVEVASELARHVWDTRPSEGRADRRAHHQETLDLLRRFTQQLRGEIAKS
jgi:hypothetical protein